MIKVIIDDVEFALDNQKPMSIHTMKIEKIGKKVIIDGVGWPQDEDRYWYLDDLGRVLSSTFYHARSTNESRRKEGNCFPTKQKAEYERLRRECMATRWVPEDGESFYSAMQMEKKWQIHSCLSKELVLLGLAAPTAEEAKARWDKYGEAWLDVLKPN